MAEKDLVSILAEPYGMHTIQEVIDLLQHLGAENMYCPVSNIVSAKLPKEKISDTNLLQIARVEEQNPNQYMGEW